MIGPAEKWMEQARYDLETARAMLASGRYLYVLFCCQQSVEKALKALIIGRSGELPPRIHNLPRLAQAAEIDMEATRMDFLAQLSAYYVQTRYPEELTSPDTSVTRGIAVEALQKTEEIQKWLFSMRA